MKKVIASPDVCYGYLLKHNPLLLCDDTGYLFFEDVSSCYHELMRRLYMQFGKGFCDPVLWLYDNYFLSIKDAEKVYQLWVNKFHAPHEPLIVLWNDKNEARKFCEIFVRGVLFLSDVPFREDAFNLAFIKFYDEYSVKNHLL